MVEQFANSGEPDHAASDRGLPCLPVTLLGVSGLQWVKELDTASKKITLMKIFVKYLSPFSLGVEGTNLKGDNLLPLFFKTGSIREAKF